MPRYLISFDDGGMDHITREELPDGGEAARAVIEEAVTAGVFVFGGGLERQQATVVATDLSVPAPSVRPLVKIRAAESTRVFGVGTVVVVVMSVTRIVHVPAIALPMKALRLVALVVPGTL